MQSQMVLRHFDEVIVAPFDDVLIIDSTAVVIAGDPPGGCRSWQYTVKYVRGEHLNSLSTRSLYDRAIDRQSVPQALENYDFSHVHLRLFQSQLDGDECKGSNVEANPCA